MKQIVQHRLYYKLLGKDVDMRLSRRYGKLPTPIKININIELDMHGVNLIVPQASNQLHRVTSSIVPHIVKPNLT